MSKLMTLGGLAAAAMIASAAGMTGATIDAQALTRLERCEARCQGKAMCVEQCFEIGRTRTRRAVVIPPPRPEPEPPVVKNWIDDVFNPSTGGSGGGGGGGAR